MDSAEDALISYAYSFDRDRWFGSFPSREEAIEAGSESATQYPSPPTSLYIGQHVAPDLRAFGHASRVIAEMRRRVREENGDEGQGFLGGVSEAQMGQLDAALEKTVLGWLERNRLEPTWSKIGRITEHPVQARALC